MGYRGTFYMVIITFTEEGSVWAQNIEKGENYDLAGAASLLLPWHWRVQVNNML